MKRIAVMVCAVLGLAVSTGTCQASWGHLFYSGYQPWWNIFAKRYKCLTPEEERLQKFWHDYYDALRAFYKGLDAIDWVAYYKNHGYQINGGGHCGAPGGGGACCARVNYAPVFVTPTLQWAVPAGAAGGPPVGPPYAHGMPHHGMPPNGMPHHGMPPNGVPHNGMPMLPPGGHPYPGHAMGGMPMGPGGVPVGAPGNVPNPNGPAPKDAAPTTPPSTPPAMN
jgi:hypothetical protein